MLSQRDALTRHLKVLYSPSIIDRLNRLILDIISTAKIEFHLIFLLLFQTLSLVITYIIVHAKLVIVWTCLREIVVKKVSVAIKRILIFTS